MKVKRLDELRALLEGEEFTAWWQALKQARESLAHCISRYEAVLLELNMSEFQSELAQKNGIDTVYLSGEQEDESAAFFAEASRIENEAMQAVAEFEEQRYRASDAWIRLGAAEKALEDEREALERARAAGEEGRGEIPRLEAAVTRLERDLASVRAAYDADARKKEALWEKVELLWSRSMEYSLLHAERLAKAERMKREAEKKFYEAEQFKQAAETMRAEADRLSEERERLETRISDLRQQARERFECVAGDDFLYWRSQENDRHAWCVALRSDDRNYNMEVEALGVYRVTSREGIRQIEPIVHDDVDPEEGDRRIEAYFLGKPLEDGEASEA